MAISEIEKNRNSENNLSYTNSNSINKIKNIRDKLKDKDKPHKLKDGRGLNKSYLGFLIISIFFLSVVTFFIKNQNFL